MFYYKDLKPGDILFYVPISSKDRNIEMSLVYQISVHKYKGVNTDIEDVEIRYHSTHYGSQTFRRSRTEILLFNTGIIRDGKVFVFPSDKSCRDFAKATFV